MSFTPRFRATGADGCGHGKTAEQLTQKLGRREREGGGEEARTKWMFDADKKYSACHLVTEGKDTTVGMREREREREREER